MEPTCRYCSCICRANWLGEEIFASGPRKDARKPPEAGSAAACDTSPRRSRNQSPLSKAVQKPADHLQRTADQARPDSAVCWAGSIVAVSIPGSLLAGSIAQRGQAPLWRCSCQMRCLLAGSIAAASTPGSLLAGSIAQRGQAPLWRCPRQISLFAGQEATLDGDKLSGVDLRNASACQARRASEIAATALAGRGGAHAAQRTGPSMAIVLFHNCRDLGHSATCSATTRWDAAMYCCCRWRMAVVSSAS